MTAYMYKERNKWWVVYGGDLFFGPSEKCFDNEKDAEKFMNEQNKK